MRNVIAALTCKCPKCKNGKIFNNRGNLLLLNIPKMNDKCPVCNYKFERELVSFLELCL